MTTRVQAQAVVSSTGSFRMGRVVWFAFFVIMLVGCAKTRATRIQDPDFAGRSFSSPVVHAAIHDLHTRQLVEEAMVSELATQGVVARAAVHVVPPTRDYTPEERLQVLREQGVDALIVITAEWGTTPHFVPITSTTRTQGSAQLRGDHVTYNERSSTQYQGGQIVDKPWAKADFAVVDLASGRMAWLGTTETKGNAMATFDTVRKSATKAVARLMLDDRIVMPRGSQQVVAAPRQPDQVEDASASAPNMATAADPVDTADSPTSAATGSSEAQSIESAERAQPTDLVQRYDGCLVVGDDGQPLGRITRDATAVDSIVNRGGNFGSPTSTISVFNRGGKYGNESSGLSAFNGSAESPPAIFCRNAFAAYLTTNPTKSPAVDPRLLAGMLRQPGR